MGFRVTWGGRSWGSGGGGFSISVGDKWVRGVTWDGRVLGWLERGLSTPLGVSWVSGIRWSGGRGVVGGERRVLYSSRR